MMANDMVICYYFIEKDPFNLWNLSFLKCLITDNDNSARL